MTITNLSEFTVDRFHRGRQLAESCKVMATTAGEALAKAKALYSRGTIDDPPMQGVTFVISEDFI